MPSNLIDNGRGFPPRDMDPYLRRIDGSFAPNAALAPDATVYAGNLGLWTVARQSQGLFRVTVRDGFNAVNAFTCSLQYDGATPLRAFPGPTVVANRTFDIYVVDAAGAVQDVAAATGRRINFNLVLRCSSLKA